jgi:hypothetical protein
MCLRPRHAKDAKILANVIGSEACLEVPAGCGDFGRNGDLSVGVC